LYKILIPTEVETMSSADPAHYLTLSSFNSCAWFSVLCLHYSYSLIRKENTRKTFTICLSQTFKERMPLSLEEPSSEVNFAGYFIALPSLVSFGVAKVRVFFRLARNLKK